MKTTTCLGVTQSEQADVQFGFIQQIRRGFLFVHGASIFLLGYVGVQDVIPGAWI